MAIFRQKKTNKKAQPEISVKASLIGEIIRASAKLDDTLLPNAYRIVIFEAILKHYQELPLRDIDFLHQQLEQLGEAPEDSAAVAHMGELQLWIKDMPQLILTLMIGLATGRGEEFAWGLLQD
ncbi:hypothetical protein [Leeia oryzae]|uniref:hypothetical protein n=1 Tax=Leeia oryzae TaxID=356662 RepID=UPI00036949B9|nr:hypothetical protein [Leeia oryzae]